MTETAQSSHAATEALKNLRKDVPRCPACLSTIPLIGVLVGAPLIVPDTDLTGIMACSDCGHTFRGFADGTVRDLNKKEIQTIGDHPYFDGYLVRVKEMIAHLSG